MTTSIVATYWTQDIDQKNSKRSYVGLRFALLQRFCHAKTAHGHKCQLAPPSCLGQTNALCKSVIRTDPSCTMRFHESRADIFVRQVFVQCSSSIIFLSMVLRHDHADTAEKRHRVGIVSPLVLFQHVPHFRLGVEFCGSGFRHAPGLLPIGHMRIHSGPSSIKIFSPLPMSRVATISNVVAFSGRPQRTVKTHVHGPYGKQQETGLFAYTIAVI